MIEDTINTKLDGETAWLLLREHLFSDISISVDYKTAYKFAWNRRHNRKKNRFKRFFFLKRVRCLHWLLYIFKERFQFQQKIFLKTCLKLNGMIFKHNY